MQHKSPMRLAFKDAADGTLTGAYYKLGRKLLIFERTGSGVDDKEMIMTPIEALITSYAMKQAGRPKDAAVLHAAAQMSLVPP